MNIINSYLNSVFVARICRRCGDVVSALLIAFVFAAPAPVYAAESEDGPEELQTTIQAGTKRVGDSAIGERIELIFQEIPSLRNVEVAVDAGVVRLSGTTADLEAIQRAETLAARVDGVVTIENAIERDVSLDGQLTPALGEFKAIVSSGIALLPLLTLAMAVFLTMVFIGGFLARRTRFWQRITPNAFIAELAATTVRVVFTIMALVLALNLLGATALLSAVLGSAGVIGLAVGFAVRDTIENYIASIMLSLRQPFRPRDHVVINNNEGRVIRLTARATILMTLDGNHLRIPNAEVFKSTILNYTNNPERRFDFELGVDADDDPLAAMQTGLDAMRALDFILQEPPPTSVIKQVGDSNIVIRYLGWINQRDADFGKSRSFALAAVKHALEKAGFGLPEPIYRLRFDQSATKLFATAQAIDVAPDKGAAAPPRATAPRTSPPLETMDTAPDRHLDEKVDEERRESNEKDLLNEAAPTE